MKNQIRSFTFAAATALTLLAALATTAVAGPRARFASTSAPAAAPAVVQARPAVAAPAAACSKMTAGDVYWVTLAEDDSIDETVETYPSETTKIVAAFDYNCIPKKTTLVTVWSLDGEAVLTDKTNAKATEKEDTWTSSLYMKDESALPDGEYGIEYYIGDKLLSSGQTSIGDTDDPTGTETIEVSVEGTVVDAKTKKPINGAMVVVLNEGVDIQQWLEDGTDDDVFASGKTDSKGQFALDSQIPTGTAMPWVIGAKGYKLVYQQDYEIPTDSEDPFVLNIALERSK
jgi:hypothetical protein